MDIQRYLDFRQLDVAFFLFLLAILEHIFCKVRLKLIANLISEMKERGDGAEMVQKMFASKNNWNVHY